jgi:DegV family protein with EDD domain
MQSSRGKSRPSIRIDFVVNTLEYLHRGGRIGGAQAFMGTMLNMKPVLEIQDGRIEPVDRVRTFTKALDRLLEIVENKITQQDDPPARGCACQCASSSGIFAG